jgi:hypothetical protein
MRVKIGSCRGSNQLRRGGRGSWQAFTGSGSRGRCPNEARRGQAARELRTCISTDVIHVRLQPRGRPGAETRCSGAGEVGRCSAWPVRPNEDVLGEAAVALSSRVAGLADRRSRFGTAGEMEHTAVLQRDEQRSASLHRMRCGRVPRRASEPPSLRYRLESGITLALSAVRKTS